MDRTVKLPAVTVAIPVLEEERHIEGCLSAVTGQRYGGAIEVLVIDGGSRDSTRELAEGFPGVLVIDNPLRRRAPGLNRALAVASGDVFVRVDARTLIAPDYVARCVESLRRTGAAMVGGAMVPRDAPADRFQAAVAAAMRSRLGVGTARFHRTAAGPGFVDTVYLGAFPTDLARTLRGYDETWDTNEDAELAWRMRSRGGVWFDPTIRSVYTPRTAPAALARQFFGYGRGRARTVVRHPRSLSARQTLAPLLLLGLLSPWRLPVALAYLAVLSLALLGARTCPLRVAVRVPAVVTVMHLAWAGGFLTGLASAAGRRHARGDG